MAFHIRIGINHESSFEAEILQRTSGCQIWGYDYTLKGFGRQVSHASFSQKHRTHFQRYVQLGPEDKHSSHDDPKLYTLETIMRQNGHSYIDILKIDLEGFEFDIGKMKWCA